MKITTLIPAYKTTYLYDLLHALRYQTVKPQRIIISDDSPDLRFVSAFQEASLKAAVADLKIEVIVGPHTDGWGNIRHLITYWNGATELFHVFFDDDYIYPNFYARHQFAHVTSQLDCSVSRRWAARESGQVVEDDLNVPQVVSDHGSRVVAIDSDALFATTVGQSRNWLGEFSNTMFRADFRFQLMECALGGISYRGLEDLGSFLKAGASKPICYINEYLGCFRKHEDQNSARPYGRPMKMAFLAYIALALAALRIEKLTRMQVNECLSTVCPLIVRYYGAQPDLTDFCQIMPALANAEPQAEKRFLELWHAYVG